MLKCLVYCACLPAEDYLDSDPSGRGRVAINLIKQGEEPLTFTGWFHAWDSNFWEKAYECHSDHH